MIIKFEKDKNKIVAISNNKKVGVCSFIIDDNILNIISTKVDDNYRGQDIAKKLVYSAMEYVNREHMHLKADCSYANNVIDLCFKNKKYIGKIITIKIDRELGSHHPKYDFIYPVNYGYVPNTISDDGEEIDVYLLGVFEPVKEYTGKCIAVIHRTNDNDDKLVIVPKDKNYTDDQIDALVEFQEQYFEHIILRED